MTTAKSKFATLLMLAVMIAGIGAGLVAPSGWAEPSPSADARDKADPGQPKAADKPLRVLLFADAATREYRFLRVLLAGEAESKRVALTTCLLTGGDEAVQGKPEERLRKHFPAAAKPPYDVIVALDADWTKMKAEQAAQLRQWVEAGGGLIVVPGINTCKMTEKQYEKDLEGLLTMLPVELADDREASFIDSPTDKPNALKFPDSDPAADFLKLDEAGKDARAGWAEFFYGVTADKVKENTPVLRGFHRCYPSKRVKPGALQLATCPRRVFDRGVYTTEEFPFIAASSSKKGRVVFLAGDEMWRLRQFNESYYNRFWNRLICYTALAEPILGAASRAVAAGLPWIAEKQGGTFDWKGDSTTMTALGGMTILMEGSTMRAGKYAKHVSKAVHSLTRRLVENGLIVDHRVELSDTSGYMYGHGFALLFLASVYGEELDERQRKEMEQVLTKAVKFSGEAQAKSGGWGIVSAKDGGAEQVTVTGLMLQALQAAGDAGIHVPKETFDRAKAYLRDNVKPATPQVYAGIVGLLACADTDSAVLKEWLQAAGKLDPLSGKESKDAAEQYFLSVCRALICHRLGDTGFARLLPNSKPEERLTWDRYRRNDLDAIIKTQDFSQSVDYGSFNGAFGKVHATAMCLTILQLEQGALPVYRR